MAASRPWVFPDDVKEYSSYADVLERDDEKLETDIIRAEQMVISYTNNRFDSDEYTSIPKSVKTAIILIAEQFAHSAFQASRAYKSETMDDWSYTANDQQLSISDLGLESLLDEFKVTSGSGNVFMRLRKL